MSLLTSKEIISAEAPDDLYESLIITTTEWEFGPSKKTKDPQIMVKWEVAGVKNKDNGIDRELRRGDRVYIIAGLPVNSTYFTLTKKALGFFRTFWCKANKKTEEQFQIDDENPDLGFLKNLYMSAVVKCTVVDKTKPLTEEQKKLLEEQGLPIKNEVVTDDEGNPLKMKFIQVDSWNRKFEGNVPVF